jgi:uncharacterized protein (TIGR00369 family)
LKHPLEDDQYCFVCGENNPAGLHLRFLIHEGKVFTEFIPQIIHQGFKDIIHGGLISTILDEAMVKAALMQGLPVVTAEMTVRFRNPLFVGEKAIVEATMLRTNRKLVEATATIKKTDETVIAEGTAKLLRQD